MYQCNDCNHVTVSMYEMVTHSRETGHNENRSNK